MSFPHVINTQADFTETTTEIPIMGLSPNAASLTRPLPSGDKIKFLQYICTEIQALSIQPTSRTDDLGKWLVVVEKNKKTESEKYLDTKMLELFKVEVPKEFCMGRFPTPRRTSVLVRQSTYGAYEETLRNMSRESEKIPVVQTKKVWKKPKDIYFVENKDAFPELVGNKKTGNQNQTDTTRNQVRQSGKQEESKFKQMLKEAEEKQRKKIQHMEATHTEEMGDLVTSMQRQLENQQMLFEKNIQEIQGVIFAKMKSNQEIILKQMGDLIRAVAHLQVTQKEGITDQIMGIRSPLTNGESEEQRTEFKRNGNEQKKRRVDIAPVENNINSSKTVTPTKEKNIPHTKEQGTNIHSVWE